MSPRSDLLLARLQSRRSVLRLGSAGIAGLSLSQALRWQAHAAQPSSPAARNVIMIFLTGGPATIDMWDMKPAAADSIRGEFRPIDTVVPEVQICEHMPRLAAVLDLVTLVRSVTHTIAEHTQGQSYVMTGNPPARALAHPALGSLSAKLLSSGAAVVPYATIGDVPAARAGDLGAAFDPFAIAAVGGPDPQSGGDRVGLPPGFTVDDLERRLAIRDRLDVRLAGAAPAELPAQLERFQSAAAEILRSDRINQALQVDTESAPVQEAYGRSTFARQALAARRLIEAGARFVTIGFGDWDTHANNFSRLQQTLLPQLDRGLAGLLRDLEDRGLLRETIVYCTGEFGRTPAINPALGRDHWARAMTALVAGGGFQRGRAYGATDRAGAEPVAQPCSPDDLSASVFQQLGFAATRTVDTRAGRPVPLFRNGSPIAAITA